MTFSSVKEMTDAVKPGRDRAERSRQRDERAAVNGRRRRQAGVDRRVGGGRGAARYGAVDHPQSRGVAKGIRPASIHDLYMAMGRGDADGFTVPAINVRAMAYDTARAVVRSAKKLNAGALIFEIARSEIGYTEQRPHEYVAVVIAAALREGFSWPCLHPGRSRPDECQEIQQPRPRQGDRGVARAHQGRNCRRIL